MKIIKKYNQFIKESLSRSDRAISLITNSKVNDVLSESDVYQYVEALHDNDDFIEGNLANRIEHYTSYKLMEVDLDELDLDEFTLDEDIIDEYIELYEKNSNYPPIVLAHDLRIIDGTHRANALYNSGVFKIKALVGQGNDNIYDEFEEFENVIYKLEKYNDFIKESLRFDEEEDEDRVTISAFIDNKCIGKVVIEYVISGYWEFEDEMTEERYDELFPEDRFAKIEYITIDKEYTDKGHAKQLMYKAIENIKSRGEKSIYLNASPMGHNELDVTELVNFYSKFGFKTFIDTHQDNKEMILTLETVRPMDSTQRTIDVFVKQFADEYNDKKKKESEKEEKKEREDIIIDEFDEDTPEPEEPKDIMEPTNKHNSLGDGATNMP